jgi:uncharacterized membrane protein YgdD (TMEM256/DUF423 family)
MINVLGGFLVVMGLFAIAGSAGDCDGKCMEYANTWEEMLMVMTIGLALVGTGSFILFKNNTTCSN